MTYQYQAEAHHSGQPNKQRNGDGAAGSSKVLLHRPILDGERPRGGTGLSPAGGYR